MYFQLLILAGLVYDTFSFVILPSKVLISTRLDPIISPGNASGHLHNIVGGNKFNATYSSKNSQNATCTTSPIEADKSAYWAPALYFMDNTTNPTTYTRINSSFNFTYFLLGPENIMPFPGNFRMFAGDATRNTYNDSSPEDQAVSWKCLDHNNPAVDGQETPGFPTSNCPDGIIGQIFFPSCWNGYDPGPENHTNHVAYPNQTFHGGYCPHTHSHKLASLLHEQIFNTSGFNVNGNGQSWILANGDVTGYSYHADFWNGWDETVFQSVIGQCNATSGDGNMSDCEPLQPYINTTARDACQLDPDPTIRIPDENVGLFDSITALPGNNPIWLAGQSWANKPPPNVSWGHVGSLDEGVGLIGTSPISITSILGMPVDDADFSDWKSRGCIADSISGRALEGAAFTDEPEMNLRKCALLCESRGYSVAGLEFGNECYCDNALRNGAHMDLVGDVSCGMPCTGNPYENCGGSGFLVILTKDGVSSAQILRLNSYFILTSSLMSMFIMTLL